MKMSLKVPLVVIMVSIFVGCENSDKSQSAKTQNQTAYLERELRQQLASRDSLIDIMNSIGEDLWRLKEVEGIMSNPTFNNRTTEDKAQIIHDIAQIQSELEIRRTKLDELQKKLAASSTDNDNLRKAITTLKSQIDSQEATISSLKESLAKANIQIETLHKNIYALNERVDSVSLEKENVENRLTNELNTAYYALGNKKELKEHKLIETGFLRKTKVLPGDFEESYFTKIDKRTLSQLPLLSKKAKVITNQPAESYSIDSEENGMKVLNILDPDRFWAVSNFLVIEID